MGKKYPEFVNCFRDRAGLLRCYFRRPGAKAVKLPGLPYSDEFNTAYHAALANEPPRKEIGADRTKPGTIADAVTRYYKSDAFTKELATATQDMRRAILERFRASHGDKRMPSCSAVMSWPCSPA